MKTVGYIVTCDGRPMWCGLDTRINQCLLYFAGTVTLFSTRPKARAAIRRTMKDRPMMEQEFGPLTVKRVTEEQL